MTRLNIIVEGQTELRFMREIIKPYLAARNIYVYPCCISTSSGHRGGVTKRGYQKIGNEIKRWIKQDKKAYLTTMFDVYGFPSETLPGLQEIKPLRSPYQKVKNLEEAFEKDINYFRFIPYLQLYEFETLLFSDIKILYAQIGENNPSNMETLEKMLSNIDSPEFINDSCDTAPSKRLLKLNPAYEKIVDGIQIAEKIGLKRIREKCQHFDQWMQRLESLK